MSDAEWIEVVKSAAVKHGGYNFSIYERRRMAPYVRNGTLMRLHELRYTNVVFCSMESTLELLAEMEEGMARVVATKLTGTMK